MRSTVALTEATAKRAQAEITELPAFAEVLDQNKAMVFSIAWHFFRDRVLAEELAQDVFLRLYRSWNSMESREHIECWLRKTMTHRCIDEIRHRKRQPHISLEDAEEPGTFERFQDPMLAGYLERMVASLPEKQRMLVILRYQEGLEPDEISKLLGMKSSTVRTMLGRAIALLRTKTWRRLGQEGSRNGIV
ncbi:MAG TPA: sigma-70 family RNA polymerase sigma factor [Bryobacteraceae bacterium]|nr:sigma-70 family RNA polymerase sigma factor [Bryobacteraceae bacterium]